MRTRLFVPALVLLAACGGGSAAPQPDGPASLGVISGNKQVVTAARDAALPLPVIAQVVRTPSGQVSLRVLDALLPEKAYAQTAVQGIAGQVVCASAPDPAHALRAEVTCATSDVLGKAYFVFHSDTAAGIARGQIAAALPTGTKITDSVSATVMPGPVRVMIPFGGDTAVKVGDTLFVRRLILQTHDRYSNAVTDYLLGYQRLNADSSKNDAGRIIGDKAVVREGDYRLVIFTDSTSNIVKFHIVP